MIHLLKKSLDASLVWVLSPKENQWSDWGQSNAVYSACRYHGDGFYDFVNQI